MQYDFLGLDYLYDEAAAGRGFHEMQSLRVERIFGLGMIGI